MQVDLHADGVDLKPALMRLFGEPLPELRITKLRGDASTRSYYRLELTRGPVTFVGQRVADLGHTDTLSSFIAMRLPEDVLRADEASGLDQPTELPFIDVQRMLARRGLPVPRVLVDDTQGRVLLLDDLGDQTFEARLRETPRAQWTALYAQAADLLARMHAECAVPVRDESIAFRRTFDRTLLRWELDHFREWGLEAVHGSLSARDRATLDASFDRLCDRILEQPVGFVHRDYQSRNLMWSPELTIIDFQDALIGPYPYDLVALLNDSYVELSAEEQQATVMRYAQARGLDERATAALFSGFHLVAVQRKLKDTGRFVFIDRVRGNPDFLVHYPQSLRYAARALDAVGDRALTDLLSRLIPGFPNDAAVPTAKTAKTG